MSSGSRSKGRTEIYNRNDDEFVDRSDRFEFDYPDHSDPDGNGDTYFNSNPLFPGPDDDDPLFGKNATPGVGNMPELTALLQDEEVLDKFMDETTCKYLREISLDPSIIEQYLEKPEIKFLVEKIKKAFEATAHLPRPPQQDDGDKMSMSMPTF